jgi:hypothetical protein
MDLKYSFNFAFQTFEYNFLNIKDLTLKFYLLSNGF